MTTEIAASANPTESPAAARMTFAKWLVSPFRVPATQKELAEQLGVAQSTLSDWKHSPEVQAVLRDWRESYRTGFVEAVEAVFRKAKQGDVPAFKALAEVLGENAPQKTEISGRMSLSDFLSRVTFTADAEQGGKA